MGRRGALGRLNRWRSPAALVHPAVLTCCIAAGLFFIGYLAQIPANMVCMVLGPRRWLPSILAAWGAVAMCFAAVGSTASFLALRLLLGVAEAGA